MAEEKKVSRAMFNILNTHKDVEKIIAEGKVKTAEEAIELMRKLSKDCTDQNTIYEILAAIGQEEVARLMALVQKEITDDDSMLSEFGKTAAAMRKNDTHNDRQFVDADSWYVISQRNMQHDYMSRFMALAQAIYLERCAEEFALPEGQGPIPYDEWKENPEKFELTDYQRENSSEEWIADYEANLSRMKNLVEPIMLFLRQTFETNPFHHAMGSYFSMIDPKTKVLTTPSAAHSIRMANMLMRKNGREGVEFAEESEKAFVTKVKNGRRRKFKKRPKHARKKTIAEDPGQEDPNIEAIGEQKIIPMDYLYNFDRWLFQPGNYEKIRGLAHDIWPNRPSGELLLSIKGHFKTQEEACEFVEKNGSKFSDPIDVVAGGNYVFLQSKGENDDNLIGPNAESARALLQQNKINSRMGVEITKQRSRQAKRHAERRRKKAARKAGKKVENPTDAEKKFMKDNQGENAVLGMTAAADEEDDLERQKFMPIMTFNKDGTTRERVEVDEDFDPIELHQQLYDELAKKHPDA